jgi:hypothetical protein
MRKLIVASVIGVLSLMAIASPASAREGWRGAPYHSYARPYARPAAGFAPRYAGAPYAAPRYAPYTPYAPYYAPSYARPVYRPYRFNRTWRRW